MKVLSLIFLLFCIQEASAKNLVQRPRQVDGSLLPKGLWLFGYDSGQSTPVTHIYDGSGARITTEKYFERSLKVSELLENIEDSDEQALASGAFEAQGLLQEETAGTVETQIDVKTTSEAFVAGYGITDNFSLLFIAPKVNLKFKAESEIKFSENFQRLVADLRAEGQHSRADEIEKTGKTILSAQLKKYNYSPNYISEWEGIPDFYFNFRYANQKMKDWGLTLETQLTLPNETNQYNDQVIPLDFFEESVSLTPGVYFKKRMGSFSLDASTTYQIRNSFQKNTRIPQDESSPFSSDKEDLMIKYGDEWTNSLQISQDFKWVTPFINISSAQKMSDRYSGQKFSGERYALLEKETFQKMTSSTVGLSFNMVDEFLSGKFPIPTIFNVSYSQVLAGTQVFDSRTLSLNIMVFYQ